MTPVLSFTFLPGPNIGLSGIRWERPMSRSGLTWADYDEDDDTKEMVINAFTSRP